MTELIAPEKSRRQARDLREQTKKCKPDNIAGLLMLAEQYDQLAIAVEKLQRRHLSPS